MSAEIGRNSVNRSLIAIAVGLLVLATGCGTQPQANVTDDTANASKSFALETDQHEQQALLLDKEKVCIRSALNNTIYKSQSDRELETALDAQSLDGCPTDFLKSYVSLRDAVHNYFAVGRELTIHAGGLQHAKDDDWANFGCSIIAGQKCAEFPSDVWASENAEIKERYEAAKSALETARRNNEAVIADYGLYVRYDAPSDSTQSGNSL